MNVRFQPVPEFQDLLTLYRSTLRDADGVLVPWFYYLAVGLGLMDFRTGVFSVDPGIRARFCWIPRWMDIGSAIWEGWMQAFLLRTCQHPFEVIKKQAT